MVRMAARWQQFYALCLASRDNGRRDGDGRTGEGCRITRHGANNGDATGIFSRIFLSLSLPPSFHFPSKDDPLLKVWYVLVQIGREDVHASFW